MTLHSSVLDISEQIQGHPSRPLPSLCPLSENPASPLHLSKSSQSKVDLCVLVQDTLQDML